MPKSIPYRRIGAFVFSSGESEFGVELDRGDVIFTSQTAPDPEVGRFEAVEGMVMPTDLVSVDALIAFLQDVREALR